MNRVFAWSIFASLCGGAALAEDRWDHRGSLGLLLGTGYEVGETRSTSGVLASGSRLDADLGGTYALPGSNDEILMFLRGGFLGGRVDLSLTGGYRGYFGLDEFKTFFDAGLSVHATPYWSVGPRVGLGVQYEFSPVVGAYVSLAGQLGAGNGVRYDAEVTTGLQFRSFLLE